MSDLAMDLFSGIGNATTALEDLGYDMVVGVDNWKPALDTHALNNLYVLDRDLHGTTNLDEFAGEVDMMHGSPPCGPFSQAGKQEGENDPKNCIPGWLWHVEAIGAPIITMENVRGLAFDRNWDYLKWILRTLEGYGYKVEWKVVNAADWGWPQARKRFYLVGRKDGVAPVIPDVSRPCPSMGAFLGLTKEEVATRAINGGNMDWVFERAAMTVVGSFKPEVMAGPGYRQAGDGPRQNAPRSFLMTEEEGMLLQGCRPGWQVAGTKGQRWLQIGNAVIPAILREIIEANEP